MPVSHDTERIMGSRISLTVEHSHDATQFSKLTTGNEVRVYADNAYDFRKNFSTLLIYSNPPFGSVSTNKLASKKGEMGESASRKQTIEYVPEFKKYGKGDTLLPLAGRYIELAKLHGNSFLAFFAPMGLFCERERYQKLFNALAKDFQYLKGYVFAGSSFHDVNKTKPIALTIGKYKLNAHTHNVDMKMEFLDKNGKNKTIFFEKMPLLKDGWLYDRRDKRPVKNEIAVQHCETFNAPIPKVFHLELKKGGSELIPENVIRPLGVEELPDELFYGLWSVSVGAKTYGKSLSSSLHPIYFDNAYVHLPDFTRKETQEILAYAALYSRVYNYAEDRIGFIGPTKCSNLAMNA